MIFLKKQEIKSPALKNVQNYSKRIMKKKGKKIQNI